MASHEMKQESPRAGYSDLALGGILGGLTSLPVIALSFLGAQIAGLPFIPFDVFDFLARVLPGSVITFGIDSIVRTIQLFGLGRISGTAKIIEQAMGIVCVIIAGVVFGLAIAFFTRTRRAPGRTVGELLGGFAFLIMAAIELVLGSAIVGNPLGSLLWLAILFVSWGAILGSWLAAPQLTAMAPTATEVGAPSRRAFLAQIVGGSLGLAVVVTGLGKLLEAQTAASGAGQTLNVPQSSPPVPAPQETAVSATSPAGSNPTPAPNETEAATLRDRIPPAPGTRPEVTANKDFYRTDIDTLPLVIDKDSWKLQVGGLFDHPRNLTLADLMAYPAVKQPVTMSCISNPVGGDLISTSNWVGLHLRDLLKDLGLKPQATALAVKSADGFYESVSMEDLMDPRTLLVYGMNGETLPSVHGFPLRIYIPNRYGMKQPKWITSIEAIDRNGPGYWVDRGWSATARPQIVSVIDNVATDQVANGKVPMGGIAWAGDRGIKKVEVQVDDGNWSEAVLRTPPLSPLTWFQWRYDWPVVKGTHTFRVRATDGTGAVQIDAEADTYPDGATGYQSVTVNL